MDLIRIDKVFKNTILCFFVFLSISVFSQKRSDKKTPLPSKTEEEVLQTTRDYISKKEYDKAAFFLSKYYENFSESLSVNWIYAFVHSFNNENKKADAKFKKAISISPLDKNLQMDYARFLYGIGKINKLEPLLDNFINEDSIEVEFLLMQANISFWKGDIKNAQKKIDQIQKIYPNTDSTKSLEEQIKELTKLYFKTNLEYQTDSQPLILYGRHLSMSKYMSPYLSPEIETSSYIFSTQRERALVVKLSNQFIFDKLKLNAKLTGGVYVNFAANADWIGGLTFSKKLFKNTSLNFGYSKNNVIGTIASTYLNLTNQKAFGELDYKNKWVLFHGWYNQEFFKDNNQIKSYGSYVLSQPIKIRNLNFQLGYSYNFTDSNDVLFIFNNQGVGIYDPYFTPKEQEIHSALFIANYKPTNKLSIEAKVNYGFIGNIRNPYPIQVTATSFEIGGFYDATFTPIELTGIINYQFSNIFSAKITYINQETFFYTRQNINLGLNFNI